MTLALYGKSNRRRLLLGIAALAAVMIAMAGGAVLRDSRHATALSTAALRPTAEGTYSQWTATPGPTHYTAVDESSCSGTDYVATDTSTQRDSYKIDISNVGVIPDGATITDVTVTVCVRGDTAANGTVEPFVKVGAAAPLDSAEVHPTSTTCTGLSGNIDIPDVAKNGATPALEIGILKTGTNSSGVRLCAISAVVNYTVPSPTIVKAIPTGLTNPSSGLAFWDITVSNPASVNQQVVVKDSGATLANKSGSGSCSGVLGVTSDSFSCTINANGSMVLRVTKPADGVVNHPDGNVCHDGVLGNTATVELASAPGVTVGTAVGGDIPIPGSAAVCRDVTITKVRSGGGPATTFTGTLSSGTPTWNIATTTDSPNQSTTVKAPNNTTVIVAEASPGPGWTTAGFKLLNNLNASCPSSFSTPNQNTITNDTNSYTICVYNTYAAPALPNLTVTKSDDATNHAITTGGNFTWTMAVQNSGTGAAGIANGTLVFTDALPSGPTYGSAAKGSSHTGISDGDFANINCSRSANTLTCTASAAISIAAGGGFSVSVTGTNVPDGSYTNPTGGACAVDPGAAVPETNESDNACNSDTVVASASPRPYVTFMKAICSSYKWVPANDLAPNIDDTGGHADELDVLAGGGDTNPGQIDPAHCTVASGWNFRLFQSDPGRDPALGGSAGAVLERSTLALLAQPITVRHGACT
jgi:hypothetical protein